MIDAANYAKLKTSLELGTVGKVQKCAKCGTEMLSAWAGDDLCTTCAIDAAAVQISLSTELRSATKNLAVLIKSLEQ